MNEKFQTIDENVKALSKMHWLNDDSESQSSSLSDIDEFLGRTKKESKKLDSEASDN